MATATPALDRLDDLALSDRLAASARYVIDCGAAVVETPETRGALPAYVAALKGALAIAVAVEKRRRSSQGSQGSATQKHARARERSS